MELLKLLSTNEIVAQLVNFFLLLILLRVFLWKKMFQVLEARRAKVSSEFTKIDEAKKDVEKMKNEYAEKMDGIRKAAQEKIDEAVSRGQAQAEELRKKAELDAQKMIDASREEIKRELVQAKNEIKAQIVDLAIDAAKSVICEKLTEDDDRKIVEQFLEGVDGAK